MKIKVIGKWLIAVAVSAVSMQSGAAASLLEKVWIHGSADCDSNRDPPIDVFEFDADTYILRQNKCVDYEAPFIYVLFGERMVFLQDTGATDASDRFPLYDTVQKLIAKRDNKALKILVTHSHSHSDHTAGDSQFRGKPGVTLIEPKEKAVREYFGFTLWPAGVARIDLGGRTLEVIPAPGHQDESVAVYDSRTQWLLTGDSVYPGRLYVKDWNVYSASISRLTEFAKGRTVSAVMGTHVEMSADGKLFPPGSTFQPKEAPLPLKSEDLMKLKERLDQVGGEAKEIVMEKFVVSPIGMLQRIISSVAKWISG